ncbi:MAG: hypothetical protein ACLFN8_02095 [Candidatus Woesearchaeota archaeon]
MSKKVKQVKRQSVKLNKFIIPTIFSLNKKEFDLKLKKLVSVSKNLQVDFMDGGFVKSTSVLPRFVPDLSFFKNNVFEAHLMVRDPVSFFDKIKSKGFKKIIFHIESFNNFDLALNFYNFLKKQKIIPVVAINPDTRISNKLVSSFDFFLLMGVRPGLEKQALIKSTYKRIEKIKLLNPGARVQIDGGVNIKTISKLFKSGADFVNSGSFISESDNPELALNDLCEAIKEV